jgi:hypothetical protein
MNGTSEHLLNFKALVMNGTIQFWAQVGKPTTFMPNFDNIYQARRGCHSCIFNYNLAINCRDIENKVALKTKNCDSKKV